MDVTFIGHGYVGLVTAAVFADLGNTVWVVGRTKEKIERLKKGDPLIFEPGLEEMVKRNIAGGRLKFTLDYSEAVSVSDIVFICVGTPPKANGEADLTSVFAAAETVAKSLQNYTVVVTKSTVPPGTNRKVGQIIEKFRPKAASYDIASSPEFLREGTGIPDTMKPDRVVIGVESERAKKLLLEVHSSIGGERVVCGIETAETIKYSSNAFLATKISFANALAMFSEHVGADVEDVLTGVGLDRRIGRNFLYPGVGYGGSCFPKDVKALIAIGREVGYEFTLLEEVERINKQATAFFTKKITTHFKDELKGKTLALLGLAFKPDTDDMREAPAIKLINQLLEKGAHIRAYDPIALANAQRLLPKEVKYGKDVYETVEGADAVVIVTEWNEFMQMDLQKVSRLLASPVMFDGRNMYTPEKMRELGFTYFSVGRK